MHAALTNRSYFTFKKPKKNGNFRDIEDPHDDLQYVQKRLAAELHNVYKPFITEHVHGYIPQFLTPGDPRSIFSNASAHLDCAELVNLDLLIFFHQVTSERIKRVLREEFKFRSLDIIDLVIKIACYKKRLPMGSPCSPVLSNMIALTLDRKLSSYSHEQHLVYSRYVDDLSFSSKFQISVQQIERLRQIIQEEGYDTNEAKFRHFKANEDKRVTGLIIQKGKLDISDEYFQQVQTNIKSYKKIKSTYHHILVLQPSLKKSTQEKFRTLKSSISGQLSFIERILHPEDQRLVDLQTSFLDAQKAQDPLELHLYF